MGFVSLSDALPHPGLAGINCHCQWGLSGLLGGIVIMLAAGVARFCMLWNELGGVFTALPVFFGWFCYQWYYAPSSIRLKLFLSL